MEPVPFPLTSFVPRMTTEELRRYFLITELFVPGEVRLHWWEADRTIVGGAMPTAAPLALPNHHELQAKFFCERREIGLVNLGGTGTVRVDGTDHRLGKLDGLYIGRGSQEVVFSSADKTNPAKFYLLSFTAHAVHPTTLAALSGAETLEIGGKDTANERTLCKLIHAGRFPTCQVVMGVTLLRKGSVWNTLPAHTHTRRNEVYLYFDIDPDQAVMHFMGEPSETRHLVVRDGQAVLSPVWSIHSGAGTSNYGFVWGMGGENQNYTDIDPVPVSKLL